MTMDNDNETTAMDKDNEMMTMMRLMDNDDYGRGR